MRLKKYAILYCLIVGLVVSSGCVFVVGAAVGVLGGYAISQDTIQGEASAAYSQAWEAALEVMRIMGDASIEDSTLGTIEATVNSAKVWVTVTEIVDGAVRIRVKSRKYMLPNLKLAQKIYIKIVEKIT